MAKLAGFGEFQLAGDQNSMNVAQVDRSGVGNKVRAAVIVPVRAIPLQKDIITSNHMPARPEHGRLQVDASATIVVQSYGPFEQKLHLGNVERSCGLVPNCDEFSDDKGGAVLLVLIGIGVGFGLLGLVGQ